MFREVYKFLHIYLTVPMTPASAERTFFTLRRLKTYLRAAMSQNRLNHGIILHTHTSYTDKLNISDIAQEFVACNERRQLFFGSYYSYSFDKRKHSSYSLSFIRLSRTVFNSL